MKKLKIVNFFVETRQCILQKNKKTLTRLYFILRRVIAYYCMLH